MCGRVRESFLFSSIQGCYLLEILHIFFFLFMFKKIDFCRVGGKILQMRKKGVEAASLAGELSRENHIA